MQSPAVAPVPLADRIDAALPQTQCTRCGYDDCRAYADAVAAGAPIDRCPPGGDATLAVLAALTGRPVVPLDASCGRHGPLEVAVIDEARCIGCTLCIAACPVDAIVGAQKRLHGVLSALCSGCELCIAPCPVDCIAMQPAGRAWSQADARDARVRHRARALRLAAGNRHRVRRVDGDASPAPGTDAAAAGARAASAAARPATPDAVAGHAAERRKSAVASALARARARRSAP